MLDLKDNFTFLNQTVIKQLLETSPIAITLVDAQGQVVFANQPGEKMLGLQPSETPGIAFNDPVWGITDYNGAPFAEEDLPFSVVKRTCKPVTGLRHAIHWPDGRRKLLSINASPLMDSQGGFAGILAFLEDITAQYEAEKNFQMLFNQMIYAFANHEIICDDAGKPVDYRFLQANPAFERMTGLKASKIIGRTILEVLPKVETFWIEIYGKVALTGEPISFDNYSRELDKHFQVSAFQPAPNQFACIFTDITEHKRIESALEDSRRSLRQLADAGWEAIVIHEDGVPRLANDQFYEMFGYAPDEILGKPAMRLTSTPESFHYMRELIAEDNLGPYEAIGVRKDGSTFPMEIRARSIDFQGKRLRVGAIRDISERKRIEQELQESERKYRALINTAPYGILLTDLDGKIILSNPAHHRILGQPDGELLGRQVWELIAGPQRRREAKTYYQSIFSDQPPPKIYYSQDITKEGRLIDIQVNWEYVRGSSGEIEGIISIISDITERKRAERALKQRLEFERLISEISSDFIKMSPDAIDRGIIKALTSIGNFSGADRAYVFQYLDNEKQRVRNTHEWCNQGIEPQIDKLQDIGLAEELPWFASQLKKPNPIYIPDIAALPPQARPDRQHFEAQKIKSLLVTPMRSGGQNFGFLGFDAVKTRRQWSQDDKSLLQLIGQTITYALERKQAEQRLRRQKERQANIIEGAAVGTWEWNTQSGETIFNRRWGEIIGYRPEELARFSIDTWSGLIHPDDLRTRDQLLQRHLEGELAYFICQYRMKHKEGHWVWVLNRGRVISRTEDGKPLWAFGTHIDITSQKQAEEEREKLQAKLAQSQKMDALGTLASGIAHDFNNILAAIMGYSELAHDELPPNSQASRFIAEITRASAKAKHLVRHILTFSRQVVTDMVPLCINQVVDDASLLLERAIPKMIKLDIRLDRGAALVKANHQQMEQVLLNLVSNAADAIEASGVISIATRNVMLHRQQCTVCGEIYSGSFVELSVKDTGAGFDPEYIPRIFDPFFTTKEIGKGTGLGLSTVFGTMTSHGGHIQCHSQPGKGTEFIIHLPEAEPEVSPAGLTSYLNEDQAMPGNETILVVDDEAAVRDIVSQILGRNGYQTILASSGEEALEQYAQSHGKIDAIILDLGMPGMGGKACLPELLKIDPRAKVLIASGYAQLEVAEEMKRLGASDMVAKPYRSTELLGRLRNLLED